MRDIGVLKVCEEEGEAEREREEEMRGERSAEVKHWATGTKGPEGVGGGGWGG